MSECSIKRGGQTLLPLVESKIGEVTQRARSYFIKKYYDAKEGVEADDNKIMRYGLKSNVEKGIDGYKEVAEKINQCTLYSYSKFINFKQGKNPLFIPAFTAMSFLANDPVSAFDIAGMVVKKQGEYDRIKAEIIKQNTKPLNDLLARFISESSTFSLTKKQVSYTNMEFLYFYYLAPDNSKLRIYDNLFLIGEISAKDLRKLYLPIIFGEEVFKQQLLIHAKVAMSVIPWYSNLDSAEVVRAIIQDSTNREGSPKPNLNLLDGVIPGIDFTRM